jgi:competence protein ComEA
MTAPGSCRAGIRDALIETSASSSCDARWFKGSYPMTRTTMTRTMIRKPYAAWLAALMIALSGGARAATIDVNTASADELESIAGIGPAISARIVQQRGIRPFQDAQDFVQRVRGIGQARMRKLQAQGLMVGNGGVMIIAGQRRANQPAGRPAQVQAKRQAVGGR